jgi:hypothetical protein
MDAPAARARAGFAFVVSLKICHRHQDELFWCNLAAHKKMLSTTAQKMSRPWLVDDYA